MNRKRISFHFMKKLRLGKLIDMVIITKPNDQILEGGNMGLFARVVISLFFAFLVLCSITTAGSSNAEILSVMNKYRAEVGSPPLVYSDSLESGAQEWANYLAKNALFQHSDAGEILFMGTSGHYTWTDAINSWGSEKKNFIYGPFGDSSSTTGHWYDVGHYTYMIWYNSAQCGCGKATGYYPSYSSNMDVFACRISPPGNYFGQYPYPKPIPTTIPTTVPTTVRTTTPTTPPTTVPTTVPIIPITELPTNGLIAYYSFNNGTARDDSGNGHSGTIHGASSMTGIKGAGLVFNGKSAYVNIPNSPPLNPSSFTVGAWVKINGTGDDYQHVITKDINKGSEYKGFCLQYIKIDSGASGIHSNNFSFFTGSGSNYNHLFFSPVDTNRWYFLTGTFDGITKKFYVNGNLVGAITTNVVNANTDLNIGSGTQFESHYPNIGDYLNGTIDEVFIYNRALAPVEITTIYQKYLTPSDGLLKANFTAAPLSGNAPFSVKFTDRSSGGPTSWSWTFGDGSTSTEQNPIHTYAKAGMYSVKLKVSNPSGTNGLSRSGYIVVSNSNVTPTITPTTKPTTVPTTIVTTVPTSQPTSVPTTIVTTISTTHPTTIPTTVVPTNPPKASFSASITSGIYPLMVQFTDKSTNSPTSWLWTFGDGSTSTEQNPSHIYLKAGLYSVKLKVSNSEGSSGLSRSGYIVVSTGTIPQSLA